MAFSIAKKVKIEHWAVGIFLVVFLYLAGHTLWNGSIGHSYPYGLLANDAFDHFTDADFLQQEGSYYYLPSYMAGGYTNAVTYDMPLFYHLSVAFSTVSGLPSYDAMYSLVVLFCALAAVLFFLIARRTSVAVAMLSLPFALFLFYGIMPSMFTWGQWLLVAGSLFLILFLWTLVRLELGLSWVLAAIALSAAFLAHFSEAVFGIVGAVILGAWFLFKTPRDLTSFRKLCYAGALTVAIVFVFAVRFYYTLYSVVGVHLTFIAKSVSKTTVTLTSFPSWALGLLLVGMAVAIYFLFRKKYTPSAVVGFFMLLAGYSNYVGFNERAFQTRYFWPIYLSVFFGLGVYQLIKLGLGKQYQLTHAFIAMIGLTAVVGFMAAGQMTPQGLMTPQRYGAFVWLNEHTPKDTRIGMLYFDGYDQRRVWNIIQRRTWGVQPDDYLTALQQGKIKEKYLFRENISPVFLQHGFFSYEQIPMDDKALQSLGLCSYDYYFIDGHSDYIPVVGQYNQAIKQVLLQNDFIKEVYSDGDVSVLANSRPGAQCIAAGGMTL